MQNSAKIITESFRSAFDNALQKKYPRFRRAYHKGTGVSIGADTPEYRLFVVDTPTERVLRNLQIKKMKNKILEKLEQVNKDYRDLGEIMNLKLRTIGTMARKIRDGQQKIIV